MVLVLLVISFIFTGVLTFWFKYAQTYWLRRGIPHKPPNGLAGNVGGDSHWSEVFLEVYNKYKGTGPFAGFYLFVEKTALLLDPELIKNILIRDFNNFSDRGLFHNERDDPLTANLFFLDSDKWRRLRHKMSPTFTSGKMKFMFSTVVKVGEEFERVMAEKVNDSTGTVLEVNDLLGRFTADVIGECAFGLECNSLRNPKAEFVVMGKRFFNQPRHFRLVEGLIFSFPKLARKLHARVIHQSVHDFYMGIVSKTVEYRERTGTKRNDFMDILLQLKNDTTSDDGGLTVEEIAAQAFVFFVAGFETSSTTMTYALYELAQNQDIQDKVRKEIQGTLKEHNNILTYECMQEMQYLEQVICETLRKHPIVPHLIRKTVNRYETSDPRYYIEAGTTILVPVIALHRDPAYYPEPEKFKPERFTREEIQKRPGCTYLPFGDGPRNCIGLRFGKLQVFIGLTYLLKSFRFSVAPETQIPYKLTKKNILMSPENGIYLRVEKI